MDDETTTLREHVQFLEKALQSYRQHVDQLGFRIKGLETEKHDALVIASNFQEALKIQRRHIRHLETKCANAHQALNAEPSEEED